VINGIRVDDFTGGLNLDSNSFRVNPNQTGDLLNVDLNPKGGVSSRWGFTRMHTTAIGGLTAGNFYPDGLYNWAGASKRIMLAANQGVYYSSGGDFTSLSLTTNNEFGASFSNWDREDDSVLYIARGAGYLTSKWDATTTTSLTASGGAAGVTEWQEDLTSPSGTHCPKAEHIATHADRLWVAGTTEGSSDYPNRVRFSHPLFPESWRSSDFIDIVGGGSKITAIVPFGGHLVVFKKNSMWAIYGYSEDTFQVVELSNRIGAMTPRAVAVGDRNMYFFSNPDGLFAYTGNSIGDLFENLRPLEIGSEINESAVTAVTVGWCNRRVYLSLPSGNDTVDVSTFDDSSLTYDFTTRKYDGQIRATRPTINFVYDEDVGKGAWTAYKSADNFGLLTPIDFADGNGSTKHIAIHPYQPYVLTLDVRDNGNQDNITGTNVAFESYYVTSWQDARNVSAKKFWRRPEFVLRQETNGTSIDVDVYHDWNQSNVYKSFTVSQTGVDVSTETWQSWLDPDWGASHSKSDSLGLSRAVQLKISGNGTDGWGLYSLLYKYNPRKVRV
jgi:hypothetical protein